MSREIAADVEVVADVRAVLGEGPVWDERDEVVWWVDIYGKRLHRFDPADDADEVVLDGVEIGCVVPRGSGGLVLGRADGFYGYSPGTGRQSLIAAVEADDTRTRLNDGKCDARGRLWAGTMAYDYEPGRGSFYRVDATGVVTRQLGEIGISNGLGWSPDGRTMYYVDSLAYRVDAFDFDVETGAISRRRSVVEIAPGDGIPDGLTVDAEGCVWLALYGGGAVRKYAPDGTLESTLRLPARLVTCCSFGGSDLRDLYVTTATLRLDESERRAQPGAGALLRCRPGAIGQPVHAFDG